jgi:S-formylglutathione hydrolase
MPNPGLPELVSRSRSFGGWTEFYSHESKACQSKMRFSIYRPPQAESGRVPILYWLSGLTCTEENFMAKAGAQAWASRYGILLVAPDTSPRDTGLPGETQSWDLGAGAGFYVDATQAPWSRHYRMYEYVSAELPQLVREAFPVDAQRESIFGHSMGGHGALVLALRQPGRYRSVSAFSPICAPARCPWGEKALTAYLGPDRNTWSEYDATSLIARAQPHARQKLWVDQGTADKFLDEQLKTPLLQQACSAADFPLHLRMHEGYDHSYYFIASLIPEHMEYHAGHLGVL